jgi:copper chaperone CopZ
MATARLHVADLGSREDEERVAAALRILPGVFGVVASHASHFIDIDFDDDEVALQRLLDAVRGAGFDARLAG